MKIKPDIIMNLLALLDLQIPPQHLFQRVFKTKFIYLKEEIIHDI